MRIVAKCEHRRAGRQGISLLEIITSVTIFSILAAVVVASLAPGDAERLQSVTRIMASDLAYARHLSIQFNTQWSIKLDTANNRYDLLYAGSGSQPFYPVNSRGAGDAPTALYRVNIPVLGQSTAGNNGVVLAGGALKNSGQGVTTVTFGPLGGLGPTQSQDTVIWLTTGIGASMKYSRLTVSWVTGQVWVDRPNMFVSSSQVLQ